MLKTLFRNNNIIAIIGPYPPPYGGISVHIERILKLLPKNEIHYYNIQKKSKYGRPFFGIWKYIFFIYFLFAPYKIIHYHSTSKKIRLLLSIVSHFRKNVYLHLHGASFTDTISENSFISRKIKSLIPDTHFIASNEKLYETLAKLKPLSIHLYDAFIPPVFNEDDMQEFTEKFPIPQSKYIISMVGWFSKYNNEDLYGFDIAMNALNILVNIHNLDISIVASVNGINDKTLHQNFVIKRTKLDLEKRFILIEDKPKEIYPLFLTGHIFIRPTNTDGNSVSIKEAQWFETPVVSSDIVPRPEKTVLFKNRNTEDLAEKILFVIKNQQFLSLQKKVELCKSKKFIHPIIKEIYGLEK